MTIHVTQKDIDKGQRFDCKKCPIALAIKRTTHHKCVVGDKLATIHKSGNWYSYQLPEEAQRFVALFDDADIVSPFSFILPKGKKYS